jgi:hypothetical protein
MKKFLGLCVLGLLSVSTSLVFAAAPPPPPPPQDLPPQNLPPPPTCSASVAVPRDNRNVATVVVSCSEQMGVSVAVFEVGTGRLLCDNGRFFAANFEGGACSFPREKARRLDYKIRVNAVPSGALMVDQGGTVTKDPTFNYPPQGRLVSSAYLKPASQKKALGRGLFWDAIVKVYVSDADVDPTEGRALIKVEIVDTTGGTEKVLDSTMANSDQAVEFKVEHEHVEPLAFGKPHESGALKMGHNTLKVRVYDAYQESSRIELPEISVDLQ